MDFRKFLHNFTPRRYAGFWFVLLTVSVMGMADIPAANNLKIALPLWTKWCGIVFIASLKASILTGILNLCRKYLATKIICIIFCSAYIFLCIVNFFCLRFYEMGISDKMIMLIAESNPSEASDFFATSYEKIKEAYTLKVTLIIVGILILFQIFRRIPQRVFTIIAVGSSCLGAISFCVMVADTFQGKNTYSIFARTLLSTHNVSRDMSELKSIIAKMPPYENASKVTSANDTFNLIVIYGESADRDHLSLYGYPLPTSPCMDSISDSLIAFSDVISAAKLTKESIEHMLTLKKDYDTENWWNYPIIIDILKAAGYKTYWISNQERTGLISNSIGAIVSKSDVEKYVSKTSNSDPLLQKYDEVLIPELQKVLTDTLSPKYIGLHLMGSHFVYENRYPASHSHFIAKDVEKTNPRSWMDKKKYTVESQYDNSIRYTDSIVGKMINMVENQSKPSVLIYLSDHGEHVYTDRDYLGRDLSSVRIPFVVFANEAFRNQNPELMTALQKSVNKKISSANLPYVLMTLTGTDCPEYDKSYDFLSPDYVERERYVAGKPWPYENKE